MKKTTKKEEYITSCGGVEAGPLFGEIKLDDGAFQPILMPESGEEPTKKGNGEGGKRNKSAAAKKRKRVGENTEADQTEKGAEKTEAAPTEKGDENTETSEKKGNGITEIVFILDKSGSMSGLEDDTIGGFNSFIENQKREDGAAYVTTVMFSTNFEKIHDRVDLSEIKPLTDRDYRVGGGTALYDALCDTIEHITTVHRYIRKEDVPEKTIFVITTDGEENASRRYRAADVKRMVRVCENELGWEFLFLGANIDAFAAADRIGIRRSHAAKYDCAETGTMFGAVSSAVSYCRKIGRVDDKWAKDLKDDGD